MILNTTTASRELDELIFKTTTVARGRYAFMLKTTTVSRELYDFIRTTIVARGLDGMTRKTGHCRMWTLCIATHHDNCLARTI